MADLIWRIAKNGIFDPPFWDRHFVFEILIAISKSATSVKTVEKSKKDRIWHQLFIYIAFMINI